MTMRALLPIAALSLTCASVASARDSGPGPEEDVTPGELIARAERRTTLVDCLLALRALGEIRDRESLREWDVVDALSRLARDGHPRVALAAIESLGALYRFDPTIKTIVRDALVELFDDAARHVLVRRACAIQLGGICKAGEFADRNALRALERGTKPSAGNPPEVCAAALKALGRIGDPVARETIREALASTDPTIRAAALEALVSALKGPSGKKFFDAGLATVLLDLLGDDDLPAGSKSTVAEAIGLIISMKCPIPGAEAPFLRMLRESDDEITVKSALKALALSGSVKAATAFPPVYDRFLPAREGGADAARARVRSMVCAMVGELFLKWAGDPNVPGTTARPLVDMLGKAIMDADRDVVSQAAVALGNLYDKKYDRRKAALFLLALMSAKGVDESVRAFAVGSLEIITGRALGLDVQAWEDWVRDNASLLAARGG